MGYNGVNFIPYTYDKGSFFTENKSLLLQIRIVKIFKPLLRVFFLYFEFSVDWSSFGFQIRFQRFVTRR